jgi:hypothetical protein
MAPKWKSVDFSKEATISVQGTRVRGFFSCALPVWVLELFQVPLVKILHLIQVTEIDLRLGGASRGLRTNYLG